jgi:hypothetical protein
MALVRAKPMAGNSAVNAYVPANAPSFPDAAAMAWLVVRDPDARLR